MKWIKVETILPDPGKRVMIAYFENGIRNIDTARLEDGKWMSPGSGVIPNVSIENVTHWDFLPDAPKLNYSYCQRSACRKRYGTYEDGGVYYCSEECKKER